MSVGKRLSELRKEHNLTQQEFADKYHVTRQTISNWENDKHYPDMGVLKQISNEYDVSFDTLFKDDDRYIETVDLTVKKMTRARKIIIAMGIVILALLVSFAVFLHNVFEGTPDGDRITSDTIVRMLVDIKDSSPSAAITKSYSNKSFSEFSESKRMNLRSEVAGKLEGDIPCISIESKEASRVGFRFQNSDYDDIQPKINSITLFTAPGMPVIPEERPDKALKYTCDNDVTNVYMSDILSEKELVFVDEDDIDEEETKVWFCIFEIHYTYENEKYVSLSAVAVGNRKNDENK